MWRGYCRRFTQLGCHIADPIRAGYGIFGLRKIEHCEIAVGFARSYTFCDIWCVNIFHITLAQSLGAYRTHASLPDALLSPTYRCPRYDGSLPRNGALCGVTVRNASNNIPRSKPASPDTAGDPDDLSSSPAPEVLAGSSEGVPSHSPCKLKHCVNMA